MSRGRLRRDWREVLQVDPTGILIVLIVVIATFFFFRRVKEPSRRSRFLKRSGMAVMALFGSFFGLFVVGETIMDPGGWEAVGLIASWFIPLVAIAALAWFRPSWGIPILAALTVAAIALMGWRAFDEGIRELEDRIGPITTIATIAVSVAATALGRTRTRAAGIMLLALGSAPFLFWGIANVEARLQTAYLLVSSPMVVTGLLYLLSDRVARRATPPRTEESGGRPLSQAA
jgi:hypothetical protein